MTQPVREKLVGNEGEFQKLLQRFDNREFRTMLCEKHGLSAEEVDTNLDTYFAEMLFGYRFVVQHLPAGRLRILEVGAGLGLISTYLQGLGHNVVALEPAGLSFDFFEVTKQEIWRILGKDAPELLEKTAEELSPQTDGFFDFSFSINVMEHIADIEKATSSISSVLKPGGVSVNTCPNYIVPYEPHFGIPLLPFFPGLTKYLFARKISENRPLWDSLNFITLTRVKRMAVQNELKVAFERGLILKSFMRFEEDHEFLERHKNSIVGRSYSFLKASKILGILGFLPPLMSTPMVFTYHKGQ
jgi:SAM-dependent methyltransferase